MVHIDISYRDRQRLLRKWQKQFGRQMQENRQKVLLIYMYSSYSWF